MIVSATLTAGQVRDRSKAETATNARDDITRFNTQRDA
jgi:hypothetical protein